VLAITRPATAQETAGDIFDSPERKDAGCGAKVAVLNQILPRNP
jgi:hypothetical protein